MDILPELLNFNPEAELRDFTARVKTRPVKIAKLIESLPLKQKRPFKKLPERASDKDDAVPPVTVKLNKWRKKAPRPKAKRPPTPESLKHRSPLVSPVECQFTLPRMEAPPRSRTILPPATPPRLSTPPPSFSDDEHACDNQLGNFSPPHYSDHFDSVPPHDDSVPSDFIPFSDCPIFLYDRRPGHIQRNQRRYQLYKKVAASKGKKLQRGPLKNTKALRNSRRANARRRKFFS